MPGFEALADSQTLAVVVLAFTAGPCVWSRFGIERLRGVGRAAFSKLPYKPPAKGRERVDTESGERQ